MNLLIRFPFFSAIEACLSATVKSSSPALTARAPRLIGVLLNDVPSTSQTVPGSGRVPFLKYCLKIFNVHGETAEIEACCNKLEVSASVEIGNTNQHIHQASSAAKQPNRGSHSPFF
jgi:hypothetical protein